MPLETIFDIGPSNISFTKVARGDFMLYSQSFHVKDKCFNLENILVKKRVTPLERAYKTERNDPFWLL